MQISEHIWLYKHHNRYAVLFIEVSIIAIQFLTCNDGTIQWNILLVDLYKESIEIIDAVWNSLILQIEFVIDSYTE